MKLFSPVIYLLFLPISVFCQENHDLINAAALQSGSYMFQTPTSYVSTNLMGPEIRNYSPEALFDLSSKRWCSKGNDFPHVFILELTETYIIEKLFFDNICDNYNGISSKEVIVHFSTESPLEGYETIGKYQLKEQSHNEFDITPRDARWIKIQILSNYGNPDYTELTEFKAFGKYKNPKIGQIEIDGRWETNWGWVDFKQHGASVGGNYFFNDGKIRYGGLNRNKITYKWVEERVRQAGWTLLFLNEEGNRLTGVWCHNDNWNKYGFWIMTRKNGVPINIDHKVDNKYEDTSLTELDKEIVKEMKTSLDNSGKVVLYGINFEFNSAAILPESTVVLNQVAELLKNNPTLKIRIEGHTDNIGTEQYNSKLSLSRAISVKEYFTRKHNIMENRLLAEGKGELSPIASNLTEIGKSANRRVEIHQIK